MEQLCSKDIDQILLYISFFYNGGMNFELFFGLLICPHKGTFSNMIDFVCICYTHKNPVYTRTIHTMLFLYEDMFNHIFTFMGVLIRVSS